MSNVGIIILAAGKGTRMNSNLPKVCFELAGKTLIQRVVGTALNLNPKIIAVVVGYEKKLVIESASATPLSCSVCGHSLLRFVEQINQNGTGDAVRCAETMFENFEGNIFVLCGDVPLLRTDTLKKILKRHEETNASCTVLTMVLENPDKYGRMIRDDKNQLKEIIEFKDATDEQRKINEINTGIYCFNSVDLFQALLKVDNKNVQNEYYLTDVMKILYMQNKKIESVYLEDKNEAAGVNSKEQLAELEKEYHKGSSYYE